MFSFLAFLFHLLAVHVFELKYAALSFTCGLAVAAALEGFVGFCLGCWMFKMAIRMGLVAPEVGTCWHVAMSKWAPGVMCQHEDVRCMQHVF
jgi:hypothetical protein